MFFKFKCFASLLLIVLTVQSNAFASRVLFTSSEELPATRMKYSDLEAILTKASDLANEANQQFVQSTNFETILRQRFSNKYFTNQVDDFVKEQRKQVLENYPTEQIDFTSGGDTQSLFPRGFGKLETLPDETYAFTYNYNFDSDANPITSISISFDDFRRKIEVHGFSVQNVEAIKNTLHADFLRHSTVIGGEKFRMLATIPTMIIGLTIGIFGIALLEGKKSRGWMFLIISGLWFYGLLNMPFDQWLPGFVIYRNDPSFLVYYGPEIGFAGLLLGIVSLIIPTLQSFQKKIEGSSSKKKPSKRKPAKD